MSKNRHFILTNIYVIECLKGLNSILKNVNYVAKNKQVQAFIQNKT